VEQKDVDLRRHLQNFYHDERNKNRDRTTTQEKSSETSEGFVRATTPGRALIENLRPLSSRKSENREIFKEPKNDLTKHFKDFMSSSSSSVKRARSFSQPKEKEHCDNSAKKVEAPELAQSSADSNGSKIDCNINDMSRKTDDKDSPCKDKISAILTNESEPISSSYSSSILPPQPKYTPKYTIDSSSTYSYYTRVRSRAAAATSATAAVTSDFPNKMLTSQERKTSIRSEYPRHERSKTLDRDQICVTVTINEGDNGMAKDFFSDPKSIKNPKSDDYCRTRMQKYSRSNSNDPFHIYKTTDEIDNREDKENNNSQIELESNIKSVYVPPSSSDEILHLQKKPDNNRHVTYRRSRTGPLVTDEHNGSVDVEYDNCIGRLNPAVNTCSSSLTMLSDGRIYYENEQRSKTKWTEAVKTQCSNNTTATASYYVSNSRRFASPLDQFSTKKRTAAGFHNISSHSSFARDSWNRTNQRYNYPRFITSQSQETFV
jgi:hypothetical protein